MSKKIEKIKKYEMPSELLLSQELIAALQLLIEETPATSDFKWRLKSTSEGMHRSAGQTVRLGITADEEKILYTVLRGINQVHDNPLVYHALANFMHIVAVEKELNQLKKETDPDWSE
jgi:hypothetical protein